MNMQELQALIVSSTLSSIQDDVDEGIHYALCYHSEDLNLDDDEQEELFDARGDMEKVVWDIMAKAIAEYEGMNK